MSNYDMIELSDEAMEAVAGGQDAFSDNFVVGDVKVDIDIALAAAKQETTAVVIGGGSVAIDADAVAIADA